MSGVNTPGRMRCFHKLVPVFRESKISTSLDFTHACRCVNLKHPAKALHACQLTSSQAPNKVALCVCLLDRPCTTTRIAEGEATGHAIQDE